MQTLILLFFFFKILCIYLRGRECMTKRESRSRGRGRGENKFLTEQGAQDGAWSQEPEIMTWAESRCLSNWAYPGASILLFLSAGPCENHEFCYLEWILLPGMILCQAETHIYEVLEICNGIPMAGMFLPRWGDKIHQQGWWVLGL